MCVYRFKTKCVRKQRPPPAAVNAIASAVIAALPVALSSVWRDY